MNAWVWKQVLKHEGEPVLTISLRRPQLPEGKRGMARIRRYYERLGEAWKARWEGVLYPRACAALDAARRESRPFEPWQAELDFTVTLEEPERLSLYLDAVERTGGRPLTVRMGDVWDLKHGVPVGLPELISPRRGWRRRVLGQVADQAEARLKSGESLLFADAGRRLGRGFSAGRFYCTAEGTRVFYPLLSLGAAAEGIPVFACGDG